MGDGDDLYALLGVGPTATAGDIAEAFARAEPSGDASARDAYDILGDTERRRGYDHTHRARSEAAAAATASQHSAAAGRHDVELRLTFDQAALGTTATVHVDTPAPCSTCTGEGALPGEICDGCSGTGYHTRISGGINIRTECRACAGAGRAAPSPCVDCHGSGTRTSVRTIPIRIPAGVTDGTRLRFNVSDGGRERERHAVVRVTPHPYFTCNGNDLAIPLPITMAEASLGATVTVPTLRGAIAIRIPPGTPHGRTFRARGHGIPAATGAGDLLATVHVVIPTELNDDQRRSLESFAAATPSPRQHFETSTERGP